MSHHFCISNGVRHLDELLFPKLCYVYVDDLPDTLIKSKIGCHIDNLCMNHVMHAGDICLMAPSPTFLQELIDNAMIFVFKMIYLPTHPNRIVWCLS